jgi:hypothetical protein
MRDMPGAREHNDLYGGQHVGELCNHRGERRWALPIGREERRTWKRLDPFEVEVKVLCFIEERRCVFDERLLELGQQLDPRAGTSAIVSMNCSAAPTWSPEAMR